MVKAKGRTSPHAEHAEAVTHPTASGVSYLEEECLREERKAFHRKTCFWPFACQPACFILLAEHERDHLWGQTEGCPKQGALKHTDGLGWPPLWGLNAMEEAWESAFYKVILTYTKVVLLKRQRNHLWIFRSAGSGSLGLG